MAGQVEKKVPTTGQVGVILRKISGRATLRKMQDDQGNDASKFSRLSGG